MKGILNKMMFRLLILCSVTIGLASPIIAGNLVEELGLTKSQVKQIKEIRNKDLATRQQLESQIRDQYKLLRVQMDSHHYNETKIEEITSRIQSLKKELLMHRIKYNQETKTILTPEQQKRWRDAKQKRRKFKKHHIQINYQAPSGNCIVYFEHYEVFSI